MSDVADGSGRHSAPLKSGHDDIAAASTPGTERKRSATWSQATAGRARGVTASKSRIRWAENPRDKSLVYLSNEFSAVCSSEILRRRSVRG